MKQNANLNYKNGGFTEPLSLKALGWLTLCVACHGALEGTGYVRDYNSGTITRITNLSAAGQVF
jgi:cytochrome c553